MSVEDGCAATRVSLQDSNEDQLERVKAEDLLWSGARCLLKAAGSQTEVGWNKEQLIASRESLVCLLCPKCPASRAIIADYKRGGNRMTGDSPSKLFPQTHPEVPLGRLGPDLARCIFCFPLFS